MPAHNILVVVVDGLRASALGAYGNTTFPTPALDRFAADSFLLDWCYSSSVDLADIYQTIWHANASSLPQQLKSLGYVTTLVTDEPALTAFSAATDFDHCLQVRVNPAKCGSVARATDTAHTSLASVFGAAADVVASTTTSNSPKLIWLHARGMYGPWDAPLELQESLLDESDPPPVDDVAPPDFVVDAAGDPDAAFRYGCAYAAQAMVLDECWETLFGALDSAGPTDRWLVSLIGARGYPLGEHRRVGGIDPRLYGEQLHVPWLIRFPDAAGRLGRNSELTTHCDLTPTLLDSLPGGSIRALVASTRLTWRDSLVANSAAGHRAIRTAEWCLRQSPEQRLDETATAGGDVSSSDVELFVRPDDRWEANDVAKLCPDVVDLLAAKATLASENSLNPVGGAKRLIDL